MESVISILGLNIPDMPDVVGKCVNILTAFSTMWITINFGILLKGRPCLMALALSLTTRMRRSILGTCSLAAAKFTLGPPGIASISVCRGANSPSACMVLILKPRCM